MEKFYKREIDTHAIPNTALNKNLDKDNKAQSVAFYNKKCKFRIQKIKSSVADPGSGAFLTPGSDIRDG